MVAGVFLIERGWVQWYWIFTLAGLGYSGVLGDGLAAIAVMIILI